LTTILQECGRGADDNGMKTCTNHHRFTEHAIGAGLTRKVCVDCRAVRIGERSRQVLGFDPWEDLEIDLTLEPVAAQ
jgi:hypothetical protein